ncbi:hypothetical protein CLU79DRAFT_781754 [Phycomyces nitens]|nr:hypothetical protein CLU79DRAFT_781754 [Phycomyces nitens]
MHFSGRVSIGLVAIFINIANVYCLGNPWQTHFANQPQVHGKFVHLTDIHIDRYYKAGATIRSDCHHKPKKHKKKKARKGLLAGTWGAPGTDCDAPPNLAFHTIDLVGDAWKDKIDFVVWTGDNARHDTDLAFPRKEKEIFGYNKKVTRAMRQAFRLNNNSTVPIVPCIGEYSCVCVCGLLTLYTGNNDIHPHNQMAGGTVHKKNPILEAYSLIWENFIPKDQQDTFRIGGYYAIDVAPKIRVLSLNTLYFFSSNSRVQGCRVNNDPGQLHLEWMSSQLEKAAQEGFKVYIAGHVGPSVKTFRPECLEDYVTISLNHSSVIAGHLYGHSNFDHFQILKPTDNNGVESDGTLRITKDIDDFVSKLYHQYKHMASTVDPSQVIAIHISPPVLPLFYPSFRVNSFETSHSNADLPYGTWTQYTQWYSNISYWNSLPDSDSQPPQYQIEYSTDDEIYGMPDLTTSSWLKLAARMTEKSAEGKTLWREYMNNMFVQTDNDRKVDI